MRRTRYIALPVRAWQYMGLLVVSLACLTLGVVARDKEGRAGSLAGPELQHRAPHDMDICPNLTPFTKMPSCSSLEQDQTRISRTIRDSRSSPSELRMSRSLHRVSRIQAASRRSSDPSNRLSRLRTTEDSNRQNRMIESRERKFARSMERYPTSTDIRREWNDRRTMQLSIRRDSRLDRRSLNRLDAERRDSLVRSRSLVSDERRERNNRFSASEIVRKQEQRRVGDFSDRRTSMDSNRVLERRDIRHVSRNDLRQLTDRASLDEKRTSERRASATSRSSERLSAESRIREDTRRVEQRDRRVEERTDRRVTVRRLAQRADLRTDRIHEEQRAERRGFENRRTDRRLVEERAGRRLIGRKFDRLNERTGRRLMERRTDRLMEQRTDRRLMDQRAGRRLLERTDSLDQRIDRRLPENRTDRRLMERTDRLDQRIDRKLMEKRAGRRLDQRADRRLMEQRADRRLDQRADRRLMEQRADRRLDQRADRRHMEQRADRRLDQRADRRLMEQRYDRRLAERTDRLDQRIDRRLVEKRIDRRVDQRADRRLVERRITEQRTDRRDLDSRRLQRLDIRLEQSRVSNLASKDTRSNQREQRLTTRDVGIRRVRSTDRDSRSKYELANESLLRRHRDSGVSRSLASREKLIRNNDFTWMNALGSGNILKGKNTISNVLTFEVIRQALVVGLCTVYGFSIFYGKRSFIRNLVNQAPQYFVW